MRQLTLDEGWTPSDRSSEMINRALRDKGIPPIQRAVIHLLMTHSERRQIDGLRALCISLRTAAEWCRAHVADVRGLKCDHTAFRKALQMWVDRGVVSVVPNGPRRTFWLDPNLLKSWYNSLPDEDELPFFTPVTTGGDYCRPVVTAGDLVVTAGDSVVTAGDSVVTAGDSVVTAGDRCRPPLTGVDSQMSDRVSDDSLPKKNLNHSITQSSEGHQSSPVVKTDQQRSPLTAAVARLPDLPDSVWKKRGDRDLLDLLNQWIFEHGLKDQLGDDFSEVIATMIGLILIARDARNPAGFYAVSVRDGIREYVTREGRAWVTRVNKAKGHYQRA